MVSPLLVNDWVSAQVRKSLYQFLIVGFICLCWFFMLPADSLGAEGDSRGGTSDDTMLMFVGMDVDVLSIASRREEGARQAPAVAHVISSSEIRSRGMTTLAEVLSTTPGFYMAQKEWGSKPYLRGIPESILFLYDTVPMRSNNQKSVHPLDYELPLSAVKRVEVIRGPGSVLWGADAFSGIVNVVPYTGKDMDGAETGVLYNSYGDHGGGYVNWGHDAGFWDVFLSVSGRRADTEDRSVNILDFWTDKEAPAAPENRFGHERADDAGYIELVGRFSYKDWLTISGRFSDFTRPYAITASDGELAWEEERSSPISFLKVEGKNEIDHNSVIRATGYFKNVNTDYRVIDKSFTSDENTSYGELVYDQRMFTGKGVMTTGISYRNQQVDDAPIWDSYLPDFLGSDNESFLPNVTQTDYTGELWSVFTQYTHHIGDLKLHAGIRQDEYKIYEDHSSFSAGAVWTPSREWTVKLLYGTAYRTPFARQLLEEDEPELEGVETVNLNVSWEPYECFGMSICGFDSDLDDHVMQDPYAGLSEPNHQDVYGWEFWAHVDPLEELRFDFNMTRIYNSGPDETYRHNDYSFIGPDGDLVDHFTNISYPFDPGPDVIMNFSALWQPVDRLQLYGRILYFSEQQLIHPRQDRIESTSGEWELDMSATLKDICRQGVDLECSINNLTDREYDIPGTYALMERKPFAVEVVLRKRW